MAAALSRIPASLPNLLSIARLVLAPVGVVLVLERQFEAAFWVLVVAGVSDAVDGGIARWFDARTRLGALLDPVADKALLVGMVIALGIVGGLPVWLVALVVMRDLVILCGAGYLYLQGVPGDRLSPTFVGKISTFLQIVLVGAVLARNGLGWPLDLPVAVLIWATGAAAVASGIGYIWRGRRQISEKETRT